MLDRFWTAFIQAVDETKGLRIAEVIDALDEGLGRHFFPPDPDHPENDPRKCPSCGGRLGLRLGKGGGFIGCSGYPDCRHTRPLAVVMPNSSEASEEPAGTKDLGRDPESGLAVTLRKGPYGFYAQLGEAEGGEKPKRASLPRGTDPGQIELEAALALLALPRTVGPHPETGETISAGIGRYGPYIKHAATFVSLKGDDDVLAIGLNRAVALLAEKKSKGRSLGEHPDGGGVTVNSGRYGPYVKHGRLNASLSKGTTAEEITLEEAVALLAALAKKPQGKKGGKKGGKAAAAGKPKARTKKAKARGKAASGGSAEG